MWPMSTYQRILERAFSMSLNQNAGVERSNVSENVPKWQKTKESVVIHGINMLPTVSSLQKKSDRV